MKAPHEMTWWERREWLEQRLYNARYLAAMYQRSAYWKPAEAALSDGWHREAERLKEILKS